MAFTDEELERYARHLILREIGGPGQKRIAAARIVVIGAGGLGSPALMYLAAAGVGHLTVIDDDTVSLSNLQRQILHDTDAVGTAKTESAVRSLARINPGVVVHPVPERVSAANAEAVFAGHDLVIDGTDNFETRYLVNRTCAAMGIPLLSGAITQWEGQLSLYDPASGGPCFACVFPEAPADGLAPSCAEAGVMGALAGIIGSMMASEAIKFVTGAGRSLKGTMVIHDALWGESRTFGIDRRDGCAVCGTIKEN